MPHVLSDDQVRLLRARAQGLGAERPRAGVDGVVRRVVGVQAQVASAGALSVRARSAGLTLDDVERARVEERSVARVWCMRGTLHLVATEDLGWLLGLLGPIGVGAAARRRAELGLGEDAYASALAATAAALGDRGPLTRAELAAELASRGIDVSGQRAPHLLARAALEGVLCHGPDRAGKPTFVLMSDWASLPAPVERETALAELARRYLAAYGPAGPRDLAAWSGLPLRDARAAWQGIAEGLVEVAVRGEPAWVLEGAPLAPPLGEDPVVRLLPLFDTYLLGYRGRDVAVEPSFARRVLPGGGWLHPTVATDGRVVATWRSERRRRLLEVEVEPFEGLERGVRAHLTGEAEDVARFLDVPLGELRVGARQSS